MPDPFAQRSYELERLDTRDYTEKEYRRWRHEMRVIHALFGENRALASTMLRDIRESGERSVSILDVGSGTGDILRHIGKVLGPWARMLVGVELDQESARETATSSISAVCADGLRLPFDDNSFDFAYCTLILHHLGDEEAERLVAEMNRVARRRIYIVDLNRDRTAYYLYRALGSLLLQPLTRDDGALSILRSFTAPEMLRLAERAQLPNPSVTRSKVNRLILSGGKK